MEATNRMMWLLEIGIFASSMMAGLILAGRIPKGLLPESWRVPVGAMLAGAGIALAVIGFS